MADLPSTDTWESRTRRLRDVATLLPIVTMLLLLPPMILVFSAPVAVAGIPLIVIYLYALWAGAVLVTFLVSRRIAAADRGSQADGRD